MDRVIELIERTQELILQVREESQKEQKDLKELILQVREESQESLRRHDKILARLESTQTVLAQIVQRQEHRISDLENKI